jgi:hypothetical protein
MLACRTIRRLEQSLAQALAAMPETNIFSAGLGASDHPGGTHLFLVRANKAWWEQLSNLLCEQ